MSISSSTVGGKIKYKIVLLGDQHVGKTSIIERFINDRFESNYSATIGIDFLVRNLTFQNKQYRLQLWDTAGQQRFKSLIPSYLKDSNICILVYDLSDAKSLENVVKWNQLFSQHKQYSAFSIVVGNKKDLASKNCPPETVNEVMNTLGGTDHFLISAKTGEGVTELFCRVIEQINSKLNNIKIIDQIEEKDEKLEKDDKDKNELIYAQGLKSTPCQSASTLSVIKLEKIAMANQPQQKRRCC